MISTPAQANLKSCLAIFSRRATFLVQGTSNGGRNVRFENTNRARKRVRMPCEQIIFSGRPNFLRFPPPPSQECAMPLIWRLRTRTYRCEFKRKRVNRATGRTRARRRHVNGGFPSAPGRYTCNRVITRPRPARAVAGAGWSAAAASGNDFTEQTIFG
jgi:hypothetical protein